MLFEGGAIDAIHAYAGGIPRLINIVADRALLKGFVDEISTIDAEHIRKSIEEIEGESLGEPERA